MTAEVRSRSGSMASAREGLVRIIRTRLPIISSGALVPILRETWVSLWSAAVSLASRVMSCPVPSLSRFPAEKSWILRNRAFLRSLATLSPTLTESTLLHTAKPVPRIEIASIRMPVEMTTCCSPRRIPASMIRWVSLGIQRSVATVAASRSRAATERRQ